MVYLTMKGFGGRPLVLGPTLDAYVKYDQFEYFSASKFQHFESMARTFWRLLVQSNSLKGFPSVIC